MSNEETDARQIKSKLELPDTVKQHAGTNSQRNISAVSSTHSCAPAAKSISQFSCSLASGSDVEGGQLHNAHSIDGESSFCEDKGGIIVVDGKFQKLYPDMSSISINKQLNSEHPEVSRSNGLSLNNFLSPRNPDLEWHDSERHPEHSSSATASKPAIAVDSLTVRTEVSGLRSDIQASAVQNLTSETEDDFNNQRLRDAIVNQTAIPTSSPLHLLSHLRAPIQPHADDSAVNYTATPSIVNGVADECLGTNISSASVASNGYVDRFVSHIPDQDSSFLSGGGQGNHIRRFDSELANGNSQPSLDMGENSIISNILSLDLDSWDDSLTSPQNLAMLLHDNIDKQEGPVKVAGSWKGQNSNQSRFSFARQEDSRNHFFDIEPSLGNIGQAAKNTSFGQEFHRDPYMDRIGNGFGVSHRNLEPSDNLATGHSIFPSSKLSLPRSQISAPPGFSAPSRPPPPGFPSHERGNNMAETSSFLRNPYQGSPSGNLNTANDIIEFIDPAILAVGKGRLPGGLNNSSLDMRPNFPVQTPGFENDTRLQLLMQRSLSPHQNLRYTDVRDNFSPPNDAYSFTSRHMDQSQASSHAPFSQYSFQQPRNNVVSNGPWDGWSDLQATNEIGMAELLRNDRMGINKFYGGYEDAKYRMSNSGDLYNRGFGM
ncbi:Protein translocase subunit SecA [Bienertia sinuspersici]